MAGEHTMITDQKIDELLERLDDTVDSLESGLNRNNETRKIVRNWIRSAIKDFGYLVSKTSIENAHKARVIHTHLENDYMVISVCPQCNNRFASPCDSIESPTLEPTS